MALIAMSSQNMALLPRGNWWRYGFNLCEEFNFANTAMSH